MGIFRRNLFKHGTRTTGTIERVAVTNTTSNGGGSNSDSQRVYLTFVYQDDRGETVTREEQFWIGPDAIPIPGARVTLAYTDARIDYDHPNMSHPDPDVPRGWAAGILEVENWGTHKGRALIFDGALADQKALFASPTATRRTATVRDVKASRGARRAMHTYTLTLEIDAAIRDAKVVAPWYSVPEPGDLIEVAISPDGQRIALDSDERFSGPPGQALVSRRPPGAPPRPTQAQRREAEAMEFFAPAMGHALAAEPKPQGFAIVGGGQAPTMLGAEQLPPEMAAAMLDQQLAGLRMARPMLGDQYEPAVRALLAQSNVSSDELERRLGDALSSG